MISASADMFTILYRQWAGRIFNHFRRMSWTAEDAADLTSEVFTVALGRLSELRDHSRAGVWLWSIAHHHAANVVRGERRRVRREEIASQEMPASPGLAPTVIQRLQRALAALDISERQLLLWREYSGLTYKEIASLTGQSEDGVRASLYRARGRLRAEYQKRQE